VHTIGAHLRVPYDDDEGAEQKVIDTLSAFLFSLPDRPPHRAGNVMSVQ